MSHGGTWHTHNALMLMLGAGKDISIKTPAYMIAEISGYQGDIVLISVNRAAL